MTFDLVQINFMVTAQCCSDIVPLAIALFLQYSHGLCVLGHACPVKLWTTTCIQIQVFFRVWKSCLKHSPSTLAVTLIFILISSLWQWTFLALSLLTCH